MRIMEVLRKIEKRFQADQEYRETKGPASLAEGWAEANYFEGATYAGWLGAGALGQQEAAKRAAAAAINASFMWVVGWLR